MKKKLTTEEAAHQWRLLQAQKILDVFQDLPGKTPFGADLRKEDGRVLAARGPELTTRVRRRAKGKRISKSYVY